MLDPAIINEMPAKSNFNKALSVFSLQQPNVWTKVEKAQTHIPEIIATIRGSIKKDHQCNERDFTYSESRLKGLSLLHRARTVIDLIFSQANY